MNLWIRSKIPLHDDRCPEGGTSPRSEHRSPEVGFPIRKSADQSLFAAPHGLSQRTTSFIASQRQGIHRMPLRHLIALMLNAHCPIAQAQWGPRSGYPPPTRWKLRTLFRKTSVMSGLVRDALAVKQGAAPWIPHCASATGTPSGANRQVPLHDVKDHKSPIAGAMGPRFGTPSLGTRVAAQNRAAISMRTNHATPAGGARRDRTDDLLLAKQALSQLSYGPGSTTGKWWAWVDSNYRPHAYQACALTA